MAALRELVAQFDVRVDGAAKLDDVSKRLDRAKEKSEGFGKFIKEIGLKLAEAFAVKEVFEFTRNQAELGEQLVNNSKITGLSVEELQKWQYAAALSGESSEELTQSLNFFNRTVGQVQAGKSSEAFQKLGIRVRDAAGNIRPTNDLLLDFSEGLGKIKSPAERMALSMEVAGRGGKAFALILGKGRQATEEMLKQADEASIVLGRDFTESAEKAAIESHKLDFSWKALKGTLAQQLFPVFKTVVDFAIKFVKVFTDMLKHTTAVKSAFIAIGVVLAILNIEFIAIAAAVGAAFLVFDDIYALLTGNKSVIGDTIDEMSGAGTAAKLVQGLKDAWNELTEAIFGSGDAANTAGGQTMTFIGTVKAAIATIVEVVISTITSVAAEISQIVEGVKAVIAFVKGDKEAEKKAQERSYAASETAAKAHKRFTQAITLENVRSADQMTREEWVRLNNLQGPARKAISTETITFNKKGERIKSVAEKGGAKTSVQIVNNIHAPGGDHKKIAAAATHGTEKALSQTDLRHALAASKSAAPPVDPFVP